MNQDGMNELGRIVGESAKSNGNKILILSIIASGLFPDECKVDKTMDEVGVLLLTTSMATMGVFPFEDTLDITLENARKTETDLAGERVLRAALEFYRSGRSIVSAYAEARTQGARL